MRVIVVIVAIVLAAAAAWTLREQDARAGIAPAATQAAPPGPVVSAADLGPLASSIRALKLVTVELTIDVSSEKSESSLTGSVSAKLTAPAVLRFGTDLSELSTSGIVLSPINKLYVITVPPPTRISAEAMGQFAKADVKTTGLYSRATDGERVLGELRRDLQLRAAQASPSDEQLETIRKSTREQVRDLIAKLVGKDQGVNVRFTDEIGRKDGAGK